MKIKSIKLDKPIGNAANKVTFGVCAACDPRVDKESRERTQNIIAMIADELATKVKMPTEEHININISITC